MRCFSMVVVCLASVLSGSAFADKANGLPDDPETGAPVTTDPAAVTAPPTAPPPTVTTAAPVVAPGPTIGIRESGFRNGFSASIGQEFGTTNTMVDVSGQLYGFDWRIGGRLTPQWSIYLQTHLSLGTANINGGANDGYTGNFAAAMMGERDLPGRTFVAIGGGYGVLNNPSGPLFAARAGWYPVAHSPGVARRLNLALDARFYFVEQGGESLTMNHIAVSLGYDRF